MVSTTYQARLGPRADIAGVGDEADQRLCSGCVALEDASEVSVTERLDSADELDEGRAEAMVEAGDERRRRLHLSRSATTTHPLHEP
jgi:hypothetical protein